MSTPIIENIAAGIATQLATITTTNGYNYSVAAVVRPTRKGFETTELKHLTVILTQGESEQEDTQQNCIGWITTFNVDLIVRPSDTSTTAYDTICNQFRADIEKALMADDDFGVTKTYSFIRAPSEIDDGVRVKLEVHYRTLETNPYSTG